MGVAPWHPFSWFSAEEIGETRKTNDKIEGEKDGKWDRESVNIDAWEGEWEMGIRVW